LNKLLNKSSTNRTKCLFPSKGTCTPSVKCSTSKFKDNVFNPLSLANRPFTWDTPTKSLAARVQPSSKIKRSAWPGLLEPALSSPQALPALLLWMLRMASSTVATSVPQLSKVPGSALQLQLLVSVLVSVLVSAPAPSSLAEAQTRLWLWMPLMALSMASTLVTKSSKVVLPSPVPRSPLRHSVHSEVARLRDSMLRMALLTANTSVVQSFKLNRDPFFHPRIE
jgi:hypothetical protein